MSEYCTCATSFDGSCQLHDRIDALTAENLSLREQVAALESREVCTVAHENVETCGYCQRDALTAENAALREERALIIQRAENAEAALVEAQETITGIPTLCRRYEAKLVDAEQEYQDARIVRKQLEARLAEAEALLREARGDYARAMNDAQIAAAVGCNLIELGVKLSALLGKIARIDAHLAREGESHE